MQYKCLTILNLPNKGRKDAGDTVTTEELESAGQTEENIQQLVETEMISEDMDADIHEAHKPIDPPRNMSGVQDSSFIVDGDAGEGVSASA